jgi:hypothetical protein
MTKTEIVYLAQADSDSSFTMPDPGSHYTVGDAISLDGVLF